MKNIGEQLILIAQQLLLLSSELTAESIDKRKNFRVIDFSAARTKYEALQLNKDSSTFQNPSEKQEIHSENEKLKYKNHTITKRSDGRWIAKFSTPDGRVCVYGKTQAECYENLKNKFDEYVASSNKKSARHIVTLDEFVDKWLELYRKPILAASSYRQDYNNAQRIKKAFPKEKLYISPERIQSFLNSVPGNRQRKHFYDLLDKMYKRAASLKYIKENPMLAVAIKSYEAEERVVLTKQQQKTFMNEAKNNCYAVYFALMLYEGLRPEELAALPAENISNEFITVNTAMDVLGAIKGTKTKAGTRRIPTFTSFKPYVKDFSPLTVHVNALRRSFNKIRDKLGFDKKITLYSLRHSFITNCAEAGVHPKVVQKWAGHGEIEITLKYYTHVSTDWENENVQKVDKNFTDFDPAN